MKITLTLLSRDKSGRQRKTEMKGELLEGGDVNE